MTDQLHGRYFAQELMLDQDAEAREQIQDALDAGQSQKWHLVGLPDTPEGGVGLSSMRERAVELGGECEIGRSSRATNGARVFARLPLTGPEGRAG